MSTQQTPGQGQLDIDQDSQFATRQTSDIEELIRSALQTDIPIYLEGPPGFGKSQIVQAVAAKLNMPMIDIRAAALLPEDISGLPVAPPPGSDDIRIRTLIPEWCARPQTETFVLFLDELNQASPSVQKALYQVVLDKVYANIRFPNMRVIAAGNAQNMWSELDSLSPALVGPAGRLTKVTLTESDLYPASIRYLTEKYPDEANVLFTGTQYIQLGIPRSIEKGIKLFRAWRAEQPATLSETSMSQLMQGTLRSLLTNVGFEKIFTMYFGEKKKDQKLSKNVSLNTLQRIKRTYDQGVGSTAVKRVAFKEIFPDGNWSDWLNQNGYTEADVAFLESVIQEAISYNPSDEGITP